MSTDSLWTQDCREGLASAFGEDLPMDSVHESPSFALFSKGDCSLDDFRKLVERSPELSRYPHCAEIRDRVPIYDSADIRALLGSPSAAREILGELNAILNDGPVA